LQLDVPAQVKLVRDIIEVALVLRLAGIMFLPVPCLQEFLREGIAVGVTLRVEARARVAIPVPGAAHATPLLVGPHREPALTQTVQLVQPGHSGADNNRDCSKYTGFIQPVHDGVRRGFVDGLRLGLHATYPGQDAPGSALACAPGRPAFASCGSVGCPAPPHSTWTAAVCRRETSALSPGSGKRAS